MSRNAVRPPGLRRTSIALVIALIALAIQACSKEGWTDEEKRNAHYILLAFDEQQSATRVSNTGTAFSPVSASNVNLIRSHLRKAYDYALMVEDKVLDKADPELRQHWKEENIEGLRLRLINFDRGDLAAEVEGQRLLDRFGDWWNVHKQDIRIPS